MDKRELNQLVFWMKERDELTEFRDKLNRSSESKLNVITVKDYSFIVWSKTKMFKDEYSLTDIQSAKLWAFLDAEIKHLNGLINGADAEDKEIAEAIYKGDIGKDVIM